MATYMEAQCRGTDPVMRGSASHVLDAQGGVGNAACRLMSLRIARLSGPTAINEEARPDGLPCSEMTGGSQLQGQGPYLFRP